MARSKVFRTRCVMLTFGRIGFPNYLERDWCELADGRNFLEWRAPVNWIMTNPPWSKLREFTRHAMTISENVVWLAPLTNLTTKARLRDLDQQGYGIAELVLIDTPKGWPQSGFQLVAAHIARGQTGGWMMSRLSDQDVKDQQSSAPPSTAAPTPTAAP